MSHPHTENAAASRAETLAVVKQMEDALSRSEPDLSAYFHDDFIWRGNFGCGVKHGRDAFMRGWQRPFEATFGDRSYETEHWMADGKWAACFGKVTATHSGDFMGIAPTGRQVAIPYIDFWRIEDGRIAENEVRVDFPFVLAQLGHDVFDGHGWEAFDTGAATPPTNADRPRADLPAPDPDPRTPLEVVKAMEQALERAEADVSDYFHDDFPWIANYGCGTKYGLGEFERNWYAPFRAAYGARHFNTRLFIEDGDWAACIGQCEATHAGPLMGIAPTGRRIVIPYIDFWRIEAGKIAENRVNVDVPYVLHQLGHDVFGGHGWERLD